MTTERPATPSQYPVLVVGAGIAGAWLAYRLAQRGCRTALIQSGSAAGSVSGEWAAAVVDAEAAAVDVGSAEMVFADSSGTRPSSYVPMMLTYAASEFRQLTSFVPFKPLGDLLIPDHPAPVPRLGAGAEVVAAVLSRFEQLGGTVMRGHVTSLVMDGNRCLGIRYENEGRVGKVRCTELVLAAGGFCGVFADGVSEATGELLGAYARSGGVLRNLEFFARFALGDRTRRRPLYPFDLAGARLSRNGRPADELHRVLSATAGGTGELDVFHQYWAHNLDVPHTASLLDRTVKLGPVRGFTMGGMDPDASGLVNVQATGECRYDLVADSVLGKPWLTFLATGGMVSELIANRVQPGEPTDFDAGPIVPPPDRMLRGDLRRRLAEVQDTKFAEDSGTALAEWCRDERGRKNADGKVSPVDLNLLVLAEAFVRSALARTESRAFFLRGDHLTADPRLAGMVTEARYDDRDDRVHIALTDARRSRVA